MSIFHPIHTMMTLALLEGVSIDIAHTHTLAQKGGQMKERREGRWHGVVGHFPGHHSLHLFEYR